MNWKIDQKKILSTEMQNDGKTRRECVRKSSVCNWNIRGGEMKWGRSSYLRGRVVGNLESKTIQL